MRFRAITAKKSNQAAAITEVTKLANDYANIIERDFASTIETWNNKPAVNKKVTMSPGKIMMEVFIKDKIYTFLNNGTRVRYATMTPGFVPKTQAGRIVARAGAGGVAYISKRRPRPGIKARKWPEKIIKWRANRLNNMIKQTEKRIATATGHKV